MAIEMFFQIALQKSFYQFLQPRTMYENIISPGYNVFILYCVCAELCFVLLCSLIDVKL